MFQDSVPAGSYNDPFLSSVCVCVCVFVCNMRYLGSVYGCLLPPCNARMRGDGSFDAAYDHIE